MRSPHPCSCIRRLAVVLPLLLSGSARAEWPAAGVIVYDPPSQGRLAPAHQLLPDGFGGAIVVSGRPYFASARRVAADGTTVTGWPIAPLGTRGVGDGAGGLVLFHTLDDGTGDFDLYALHYGAQGGAGAGWSGPVTVCGASGAPSVLATASDDAGGAFVAWLDSRGAPAVALVVQHLRGDGTIDPAHLDGVVTRVVSPSVLSIASARLASDRAGGCYLLWHEQDVAAAGVATTLRLQRLDPALQAQWSIAFPIPRTLYPAPQLVSDGGTGAYLAWQAADAAGDPSVWVTRCSIMGGALPGWTLAGTEVGVHPGSHIAPALALDGAGGVYVAWAGGAYGERPAWITRMTGAGGWAPGWSESGVALSGTPNVEGPSTTTVLRDPLGGAVVAWDGAWQPVGSAVAVRGVRAQRVEAAGALAAGWPADGFDLSVPLGASIIERDPQSIAGGYVSWLEAVPLANNEVDYAVYLQRLGALTPVPLAVDAQAPAGLALLAPRPNPARGDFAIDYRLAAGGPATLELFDAAGRRVAARALPATGAGPQVARFGAAGLAPGVYLVRLAQGARVRTARIALVR